MINNDSNGKLDPEQPNSNELEKNEAEYLRMNTDDSDREIDPKEQPGSNEFDQSNPKDLDLISKEIEQEEEPRYTQPEQLSAPLGGALTELIALEEEEQRNPKVFGFNNVDSNGEKSGTSEFEVCCITVEIILRVIFLFLGSGDDLIF